MIVAKIISVRLIILPRCNNISPALGWIRPEDKEPG
jgi:hypothetical protein